ncbi:MAG: hypothetical protein JWM80_431 [Cyanobacteria bacterium RYN_339]|nr:hypothetical protein [Cyanobacteria bacterium RYN_339]
MQIGNSNVPIRVGVEPLTGAQSQAPERQLKRLMVAEASQKVFQETRRQLTEASRRQVSSDARGPLLTDIAERLAGLANTLQAPKQLGSASALDLGPGSGNALTGVDANRPLDTQSFGQPISAGKVDVTLQVNGGAAVTQQVTIDPTQSLNANLQQFSNLTVGGVNPLTAFVSGDQVVFQADSASGSNFKFSIQQAAAGGSNFVEAVTNGTRGTNQSFTGNASVGAAAGTIFANLTVNVGGQSLTINNLTTSSTLLTPGQRATELAAKINDGLASGGLAANGVQAIGLANGKLQLVDRNGNAALSPALNATITEAGAGQTLGFGGGFTTSTSLSGSGYLSGPDATLANLAGSLGLKAENGAFTGTVNGVKLRFDQQSSLSSALADITNSAAGVNASFDTTTRRVTLSQKDASPRPVDVQDTSGNFFASLKLTQAGGADPQTGASGALQNLRGVAQALSDTLGRLETATGKGGAFKDAPLLQDLNETLARQFKPSQDGQLRTLADFGFTRDGGQLHVDEARVQDLAANRADEVLAAAGALASQQLAPLAREGQQALSDELALTPFQQRLAQQNVHARAELGRLQDRQSSLLHQQVVLNHAQETVERLRSKIEKEDKAFGSDDRPHVPPRHADLLKPLGHETEHTPPTPATTDRNALPPTSPATSTQGPGAPAGLLSFGLNA